MPETVRWAQGRVLLRPFRKQHQSPATCVKASPVVMGVGIQGEGYAKYFLEGLWKDLYERRKCEWDVDNLSIKL